MQGKVVLEEHFAIPDTLEDSHGYFPDRVWQEVKSRVMDIHERRLREMDDNGIELMFLSLNAPAVQAIPDEKRAAGVARKANDYLAEQVAKRPDRFQGLAALAMQVKSPITICRNIGRSGRPSSGLMCRSICIRAIPCRATAKFTRGIRGCWVRSGHSATRRRFMPCA